MMPEGNHNITFPAKEGQNTQWESPLQHVRTGKYMGLRDERERPTGNGRSDNRTLHHIVNIQLPKY